MTRSSSPVILSIDDDPITLKLIHRILSGAGYNVMTAQSGAEAFNRLGGAKPDLILLDIMMSGMNGYEVCAKIQENEKLAYIPVIFVTALNSEPHKAKAFAVGGVGYITKPFSRDDVLRKVNLHLKTNSEWKQVHQSFNSWQKWTLPENFLKFKQFLLEQLRVPQHQQPALLQIRPSKLYSLASELNLTDRQLAQYIAQFLKVDYKEAINSEELQLGVLPPLFCKANSIVPVRSRTETKAFVLSNPFHWELLDLLNKSVDGKYKLELSITEPENISSLFSQASTSKGVQLVKGQEHNYYQNQAGVTQPPEVQLQQGFDRSVEQVTNSLLAAAVSSRASDIHLQPKSDHAVVRFRIDGDLREVRKIPPQTAAKMITRMKALAGLEVTERRRPQDGAFQISIDNRQFRLRLATTSTPEGESLVVRLLEPTAKPKALQELGMNNQQVQFMLNFAQQTQGLVVIVGPTGSGKSTTIYSLLSQVDTKTRSLISVEDPIEYRIQNANQQQVNEKADITFESLLKSAMRQDPDILFLGEIRDPYSAKASMDFASTGHLTISSLHSASATSAIFRFEQLSVTRATMADALLGVVAQKLLKKLCPHCKKVEPITEEEVGMLSNFTQDIPDRVAHPVGCPKCYQSGYLGREAIYEILHFDAVVSEMVRRDVPLIGIRDFVRKRGDTLIADHAIEKVRDLLFSPQDIYHKVLAEEARSRTPLPRQSLSETKDNKDNVAPASRKLRALPSAASDQTSVLAIEHEESDKALLQDWLGSAGYEVVIACDGMEALFELGSRTFDVIVSNVNMPSLGGQRLLEILKQKNINIPVIFTANNPEIEIEAKGLDLGAADYIRKPLRRDIVLLRVNKWSNFADSHQSFQQSN